MTAFTLVAELLPCIPRRTRREELTVGLSTQPRGDLAGLLEVNVPALGLASLVLEGEGVDAVALLDGVLAVGVGRVEGRVDGVEGGGGRELVCGLAVRYGKLA